MIDIRNGSSVPRLPQIVPGLHWNEKGSKESQVQTPISGVSGGEYTLTYMHPRLRFEFLSPQSGHTTYWLSLHIRSPRRDSNSKPSDSNINYELFLFFPDLPDQIQKYYLPELGRQSKSQLFPTNACPPQGTNLKEGIVPDLAKAADQIVNQRIKTSMH